MKYKILKNASKLNEGKDWSDPTRRYVNMDYTAKERQINKELREQLKALKVSEPHKRHMIKGGKIVSEVVKKDWIKKDVQSVNTLKVNLLPNSINDTNANDIKMAGGGIVALPLATTVLPQGYTRP